MKKRWLELIMAENNEMSWFAWHGAEVRLAPWWETKPGTERMMVLIKDKCPPGPQ